MLSSARPWQISGVAGLLFVVTSFVGPAINVQPPQNNARSFTGNDIGHHDAAALI